MTVLGFLLVAVPLSAFIIYAAMATTKSRDTEPRTVTRDRGGVSATSRASNVTPHPGRRKAKR